MRLRTLNATDEEEWAQWVHRYLQAQLENVPEWENDPQKARAAVPGLSFEALSQQLRAQQGPAFHSLLLEEENTLLGQLLWEQRQAGDTAFAWVHALYVLPAQRRKGRALSLLQAAAKRAQELGLEELYFAFHQKNKAAEALAQAADLQPWETVDNGIYENWIWRKALNT